MSKIEQIKIPMDIVQPRIIKIIKHKELENAIHPGNIEEGCVIVGEFMHDPVVGQAFWVKKTTDNHWRTSVVTEIINPKMFKTMNSVYIWEDIELKYSELQ